MEEKKTVWKDPPTAIPMPWKKDFSNFADCPQLAGTTALEKVQQFRAHEKAKPFIQPKHHDLYIMRWIVARNFDIEKAVEMFIESMKWRQRTRVDFILDEFPKDPYFKILRQYWPDSVNNDSPNKPKFLRTVDGCSFYLEGLAYLDPSLLDYFPVDVVYRSHVWVCEMLHAEREQIYEETGLYGALTVIEDLEPASLGHLANQKVLNVVDMLAKIDQDNYPECLRKVYLVNSTKIFSMIWNIIQYFFDENTKAKFSFYELGKSPTAQFVEVIHPDCLPTHYGGTVDWTISKAGKIKDWKFDFPADNDKKLAKWEKQLVKYTHEVEFDVQESWTLTWEFTTKDYDIGFGLKYKESKDHKELVEVIAVERVESFKSSVHGLHVAEKRGIYVLYWDNSYSYTKNKDLKYKIKIKDHAGETKYPVKKGDASPLTSNPEGKEKKSKK